VRDEGIIYGVFAAIGFLQGAGLVAKFKTKDRLRELVSIQNSYRASAVLAVPARHCRERQALALRLDSSRFDRAQRNILDVVTTLRSVLRHAWIQNRPLYRGLLTTPPVADGAKYPVMNSFSEWSKTVSHLSASSERRITWRRLCWNRVRACPALPYGPIWDTRSSQSVSSSIVAGRGTVHSSRIP
jgi:hypothetical protein